MHLFHFSILKWRKILSIRGIKKKQNTSSTSELSFLSFEKKDKKKMLIIYLFLDSFFFLSHSLPDAIEREKKFKVVIVQTVSNTTEATTLLQYYFFFSKINQNSHLMHHTSCVNTVKMDG